MPEMNHLKMHKMPFANVSPLFEYKTEKQGGSKTEVDGIRCWLTGYDRHTLQQHIDKGIDFEIFFSEAPRINPNASKITGVICGYCVEESKMG